MIIGLKSNRGNGFGPSDLIERELSVWDRGAVDLKSNGRHSVPVRYILDLIWALGWESNG